MTFSIVARSADGQSWGVAVASKYLAVGNAVPAAVAGVGAVATQAVVNVAYKGLALAHLDTGASASVTVQHLIEEDPERDHRQVGVVDAEGVAASYTGTQCHGWAGGLTGDGYAVQGNILAGPEVVAEMERAFLGCEADLPLATRLLAALRAGEQAGGDRRGRQAAALLVVRDGAGFDGMDDVAVDLRVDDHPDPMTELARLLDLNDLFRNASADEDKVPVIGVVADEVARLLQALGHDDLVEWAGNENLGMRVAPGGSWIDQRVLEILRRTATKEN